MLKKRLIFTLLYGERVFNLSRNFQLQRVGDLTWLKENYELNSITKSIDELILLDVNRAEREAEVFQNQLSSLARTCFMPLAAGGGIKSLTDARRLFLAGADKVVVNTSLFESPEVVRDITRTFGAQAVVASVDYRTSLDGRREVYLDGGKRATGMSLKEGIDLVNQAGVGELYLTSINHDGTGTGYDLEGLREALQEAVVPIIVSGGAGNYAHLVDGLRAGASAVSTANLFNFMADGLEEARRLMLINGVDLCMWTDQL